ncbi:hypothetical protein DFH11DRAFT_1548254 [Phellopilus nigrolimitatus]|nr:hypothetical protein DFH11DRAFT_1548254 [Phellopilus nigrolimitatus]
MAVPVILVAAAAARVACRLASRNEKRTPPRRRPMTVVSQAGRMRLRGFEGRQGGWSAVIGLSGHTFRLIVLACDLQVLYRRCLQPPADEPADERPLQKWTSGTCVELAWHSTYITGQPRSTVQSARRTVCVHQLALYDDAPGQLAPD